MPWTPSLPSSGHRSRGKVLLRSISSARGAICVAAKLRTLSRSMSAVSPSPKLNPPRPPASMGVGLSENQVLGEYGQTGAVLQSGDGARKSQIGTIVTGVTPGALAVLALK